MDFGRERLWIASDPSICPGMDELDCSGTFATTRHGGSPLHGSHRLDDDLKSIACEAPRAVHIVTRNSFRDDIVAFLAAQGVPSGVSVHTVKKHESKATVVRALLDGDAHAHALFVDDSIAEHVDAGFRECRRVQRVLFAR